MIPSSFVSEAYNLFGDIYKLFYDRKRSLGHYELAYSFQRNSKFQIISQRELESYEKDQFEAILVERNEV